MDSPIYHRSRLSSVSSASSQEETLSDELRRCLVASAFDTFGPTFVPHNVLDRLINERSILASMEIEEPSDEDNSLVDFILTKGNKVFAISVYIGLGDRGAGNTLRRAMQLFKENDFDNDALPLGNTTNDPSAVESSNVKPVSASRGEGNLLASLETSIKNKHRIWGPGRILDFCEHQWKFLSPVFSPEQVKYDLPAQCILPFVSKQVSGSGAFSHVYKYEIHPDHFQDPMLPRVTRSSFIAVKEFRLKNEAERAQVSMRWASEVKALTKMNKINRNGIVRFIAAFRRGRPGEEDHYIMFEWADGGNLRYFWQTVPQPTLSASVVREMIIQLDSLAAALSTAHYPDMDGAAFRHGNLKPENILRFLDNSTIGKLKIGGWGRLTEYSTRRYEAPEVEIGLKPALLGQQQQRRSRLYDIWAMGCIVLEFIIWLLYGLDGLDEFNESIKGDTHDHPFFYQIAIVDGKKLARLHPAVVSWMDHMAWDLSRTVGVTALGDLLELVKDGLLVVQLPRLMGSRLPLPLKADLEAKGEGGEGGGGEEQGEDDDSSSTATLVDREPLPEPIGPSRLLATDFHKRLEDILAEEHDNYWLTDGLRLSKPVGVDASYKADRRHEYVTGDEPLHATVPKSINEDRKSLDRVGVLEPGNNTALNVTSITIQEALDSPNSGQLLKLLESDFDRVAQGEYAWLHELDDIGYSRSEIANLLLEEAQDAPWIHFNPEDLPPLNLNKQSLASLLHVPGELSSPWVCKRPDVEMIVQRLCGLAGVAPISRSTEEWNGTVTFKDKFSVALISYAASSDPAKAEVAPHTVLLSRLKRVVKNLRDAVVVLQGAHMCSDYFTIVRTHSTPAYDPMTEPGKVEVLRVDVAGVFSLHDELELLDAADFSPRIRLRLWLIAENILRPLLPSGMHFDVDMYHKRALHPCALAVQFLCLGLVSFCQGHVGPLDLSFVNHSQTRLVLLGAHTLDEELWGEYHIKVSLSNLTCFGQMTGGPLLTFDLRDGKPEEIAQLAMAVSQTPQSPHSDNLVKKPKDTQREHHLVGMAEDILCTWGPGRVIPSESDSSKLRAICVGDGIIYPKPAPKGIQRFHWQPLNEPNPVLEGDTLPVFDLQTKITVGARVTENPNNCAWDCQYWRPKCRFHYLGVREARWEPNQRQLGLQAGPSNVAFQGNQTYQRIPAKLLKQFQLEQDEVEISSFFGCYVGVQVSCCTGVARRVSLQKLLADLVPLYCKTNLEGNVWRDWDNMYGITTGLRNQDFNTWYAGMAQNFPDAAQSLTHAIRRVLEILEPTGLSRDQTYLFIAWPQESDLYRGLKIPCDDECLWTRILVDSVESVTFAYMTPECLLHTSTPCQQQCNHWRASARCLGTAVTRYRHALEREPDMGTWGLEEDRKYHIWNAKSYIVLRATDTVNEPRLLASKSRMSLEMIKRHFYGQHWRPELLIREHHHPNDDEYSKEVVIVAN